MQKLQVFSRRQLTQRPFLAYPCVAQRRMHWCSARRPVWVAQRLGMGVKPFIDQSLPFSVPLPHSLNLSKHPIDVRHKNPTAYSPRFLENAMRTMVAAFVVMSIVFGLDPPHSIANAFDSSLTGSRDRHIPAPQPQTTTRTSQSLSSQGGVFQQNAAQDCTGEAPSTGSVPPLLSRLVRSSGVARGVQCPIPPLPDESQLKELHP
jgi:hypothetical protein